MEKRIIEVNGVKLEIDLSEAKVIENYKVGDAVKVLVKEYSSYKSHAGVIIGFDAFKNLPTIIVAYIDASYSKADMQFVYFNEESKDVEICAMNEKDVPFVKSNIIEIMDRNITAHELTLHDLKDKKNYFLKQFGVYFKNLEKAGV